MLVPEMIETPRDGPLGAFDRPDETVIDQNKESLLSIEGDQESIFQLKKREIPKAENLGVELEVYYDGEIVPKRRN